MTKIRFALTASALAGALAVPAAIAPTASAGVAAEDAAAAAAAETNPAQSTAGQPGAPASEQSALSELEVEPWIAESQWYKTVKDDPRVELLQATSPAMNGRKVPLAVIPAQNPNRPTIYLLNGAGSGEQDTDWFSHSPVVDFYSGKDVNAVVPMTGAFSYFIDWQEEPTGEGQYLKGPQKWETFLTKELPGPIESKYNANDKRAIAGMSMSATSSLLLAEHNPGFYNAVGSFAGCAATSDPLTYDAAGIVLGVNKGVIGPDRENARRMLGPQGSPSNRYNDALVNAENLRGTETYVSASPGVLSEKDMPGYITATEGLPPEVASAKTGLADALQGIPIEGAVNKCTHDLQAKTNSLGVPVTYNFRDVGVHNWNGWNEDLEKSWEVFERGFNK